MGTVTITLTDNERADRNTDVDIAGDFSDGMQSELKSHSMARSILNYITAMAPRYDILSIDGKPVEKPNGSNH